MKKGRTQSLHFWSNFDPRFPLKMVTIKEEVVAWKNHSHWAIKICQNEGSTFSPLSEKNTITFCTIQVFFGLKQGGVTSQRVGITHTIPGQLLVKKTWLQHFSVSSLATFLGTTPTFLKKLGWISRLNLMLDQIKFQIPKGKTKKLVFPFLTALFYFEINLIRCFSSFLIVGKFLPSRPFFSKQNNWLIQIKLRSKEIFLPYTHKIQIKNSCNYSVSITM